MHVAHYAAVLAMGIVVATGSVAHAARPANSKSAAKIDKLLHSEMADAKSKRVGQTDDATFLRRASLDTIGRNPTPEEIAAFALDPSKDKRRRVVERLLSHERFGQNWARYWRDVIFSRRLEERSLVAANTPLVVYI